MSVKTPHVHAAVIKAWADGARIQVLALDLKTWIDVPYPDWVASCEYRVKPEPKPDSILLRRIELTAGGYGLNAWLNRPNLKFTFDGETNNLKGVELIENV